MPAPRYRLSAPLTIVWRSAGHLQVGLDADGALLLGGAPPGADAALRLLRTARSMAELERLLPEAIGAWLSSSLPALVASGLVTEVTGSGERSRVALHGDGILGAEVRAMLDAEGLDVVDLDWEDWAPVLVCSDTIEPDRAVTGRLRELRRPHMVVRAEPERTVVGPFVLPGTPCVTCTDLARRDVDDAWPHLLAQLCRARHTPSPAQTAWAASVAVAQMRAWLGGATPTTAGATLELETGNGRLGTRVWPRHARCPCQPVAAAA